MTVPRHYYLLYSYIVLLLLESSCDLPADATAAFSSSFKMTVAPGIWWCVWACIVMAADCDFSSTWQHRHGVRYFFLKFSLRDKLNVLCNNRNFVLDSHWRPVTTERTRYSCLYVYRKSSNDDSRRLVVVMRARIMSTSSTEYPVDGHTLRTRKQCAAAVLHGYSGRPSGGRAVRGGLWQWAIKRRKYHYNIMMCTWFGTGRWFPLFRSSSCSPCLAVRNGWGHE